MRNLLAFTFALAAAAPLWAQDIIKFRDPAKNADMEGAVVSMSFKLVEIDILVGPNLVKRPAEASQIAEIIPSNSRKSYDFAQGEAAMTNADFATAIQRFERVASDPRATELMRQLAAINVVRCHSSSGDLQGVIRTAQALRARKSDSYYARDSFELEVQAHLALRNPAGANAAIGAFAVLGNAHGMREWANSIEIMQAAVAEFQANWRGALATYKKFSRNPDVGDEAAFGELRCLTALSDWPGLNARADALLKESRGKASFNPRLLIAAYNGKGDIDLNAGKPKEALSDYLQGAWVVSRQDKTSPEHEASLARSSIACAKLAMVENDRTKRDIYRSRAQELLRELTSTYPGSRFKSEVEKAIRELR